MSDYLQWDRGFDAFFASDGDEDAWIEALHKENLP